MHPGTQINTFNPFSPRATIISEITKGVVLAGMKGKGFNGREMGR